MSGENEMNTGAVPSGEQLAEQAGDLPRDGKVTYTAEEVRAMLQSEADRRVSGARKRWEKELGDRIEAEARQLAGKMSSDYAGKIAALEAKLSEALEQNRSRERELEIIAALGRASLPGELLPMVKAAGEGTEQDLIDALRRTVDECTLAECARRIGTKGPAAETRRSLTSEEIRSLPVARLAELMGR